MRLSLSLFCALAGLAAPAGAQTFNRAGTGWSVLGETVENEGSYCFLSAWGSGETVVRIMLRVSDLRTYFQFTDRSWRGYRPGQQETMTVLLDETSYQVGTIGVEDSRGRGFMFGQTLGDAFTNRLREAGRLTIRRGEREIESFSLEVLHEALPVLAECGLAMTPAPAGG